MRKVLIIGGGFAGCAAAHQLSEVENLEIDLIEKASFLGAGNKTRWYGGHPYTFGPRHFLTPYEDVFKYLNDILPINLCPEHEFLSYVEKDNDFYAYPINMQDVRNMPEFEEINNELKECKRQIKKGHIQANNLEEYWIKSVGKTLYKKMIEPYNKKMWLVDDVKKIDTFKWSPKGVTIKDGPRAAWDNVYSGYPFDKNGYDHYFTYATSAINVFLNTSFEKIDIDRKTVVINGNEKKYDIIVNTIGIDDLFSKKFGALPYLGRKLELIVLPVEEAFPKDVFFLYYTGSESFTRLVEYKKFTKHKSKNTLIGMEIPVDNGGKDYPMPFKSAQLLALKYLKTLPNNFYSMGRAGSYLYGIDIDDCIKQSFYLKDMIKEDNFEYPVPGKQYHFPEL